MAISKQQKEKNKQGYIAKPIPNICSKCEHFLITIETATGYYGYYTKEKDLRCALGGFAVKKTATCNEFKIKEQS